MVFSSVVFLFAFLPTVLIGYYLLNPIFRNVFLLCSSLFFYTWGEPKFIFVMIASIAINYIIGMLIDKIYLLMGKKGSVFVLAGGVLLNLALLVYFKYFNFIVLNLNNIFNLNLVVQNIALPIGISFFTFQGMSYIIDLYRREIPVQRNPISVALYISLFPQLIAGPIVRYSDIYLQINERKIDVEKFAQGIKRFIIGLSKKILLANVLGEVADLIFGTPFNQVDSLTAWLGIICYTIQIYFDFSGYSDMAIGLGKMFGFDFMENFNLPYISKSITEFWRRWHISLSTWFRDYLYIPLGGNRSGNVYFNLLLVFVATGLWHGAAWNFLCWGLWHGLFLIIERIVKKKGIRTSAPGLIKWGYTMFVVVIGWVLFRADGIQGAFHYLMSMFNFIERDFIRFSVWYYLDRHVLFTLFVAGVLSSHLPSYIMEKIKNAKCVMFVQPATLLFLMVLCVVFVVNSSYNPFIYFRF